MENSGSSFIPKNPINATAKKRRVRKIYVVTYVVYVLFVAALIGTGGVWFYKQTLLAELTTVSTELANEQDRFNQSDLERLSELDARLDAAEKLFNERVSMANLFTALEEVTVSSVVLEGFSYEKDEANALELTLAAVTDDFNTALFQRSVLAANTVLAGASLEEITYTGSEGEGEGGAPALSFTIAKQLRPADLPVPLRPDQPPVTTADEGESVVDEESAVINE